MADAGVVLKALRAQAGIALNDLPSTSGLYALRDHLHAIRYIGIAHSEGFRVRIRNKHTTGSEDRSHKFSAAYNSGRLWRDRHSGIKEDSLVSKRLRNIFILRHCSASCFEVRDYSGKVELELIEKAVIALADPGEITWNGKFEPKSEPKALVDSLLAELRFSPAKLDALARQEAAYSVRDVILKAS